MARTAEAALVSEHFAGSSNGFLNLAVDWVGKWVLTHDLDDWEALLEAAQNDGLEEDEIAAALDIVAGANQVIETFDVHNIK